VTVLATGPEAAPKPSLVEGNQLRCPKCEQLGDLFRDFRALERNEKYAHELNMIYKHKACGHVFSPGDPQIIAAYLAGDLVPRSLLDDARRQLREGGVQAA
jgi:uncharacterized protein (DUF983 family)